MLHHLVALQHAAESDEEESELHAARRTEHGRAHGVDLVGRLGLDVDEEVVVAAELVEQALEHAPHRLGAALVAELGQRLTDLEAGVGVEVHRVAPAPHGTERGLVAVELLLAGPRVLALEPAVDVLRRRPRHEDAADRRHEWQALSQGDRRAEGERRPAAAEDDDLLADDGAGDALER